MRCEIERIKRYLCGGLCLLYLTQNEGERHIVLCNFQSIGREPVYYCYTVVQHPNPVTDMNIE